MTSSLYRFLVVAAATALTAAACSNPPAAPAGTPGAAGASETAGSTGTGPAGASGGTAGTTGASAGSTGAAAGATGSAGNAGASGGVAGATATDGGAGAGGGGPDTGVTDPGTDGDGDFTIMGPYTNAPELTVNAAVPHGAVHAFTIASTESPIFPGVTGAYTRQGWLYVPKQYVAGTPAPFVVVQDGRDYVQNLPVALDNMIAAKRVPVMLAIMVMAGPGDGPGSERGFEYDTVSDAYTMWVESTVLPKMKSLYGVAFTTDPEGRSSIGGSSGGSAAFTMGWFHPELYRRFILYSGSFVDLSQTAAYPQGAWEYPDHLVMQTPAKPLRVHLEAADMDNGYTNSAASMKNWLIANQMMVAALKAQGYHYHYDFAKGGVHNDQKVVGSTLPAALEWLWRGYPIQ